MTQAVENIPKRKIKVVEELTSLINESRTILIADVDGIPGAQYQAICKKVRGKAIVKVPKKNLFHRALEASKKKSAQGLKEHLDGAIAILFSDLDSYDLAGDLLKSKSPAKAKAGQIAPTDIEIPAGPTDLVPGPAISELGALGIKIMIKAGKIDIKDPTVVAKEGKEISEGAANMLAKLNILPFTIGFKPLSAYDSQDEIIYANIEINKEAAKESLLEAYSRALPFAVEIGYYADETTPLMVQKAASYERKLIRVISGEPEEEIIAAPAEEETKPEEKTEAPAPAADFGGFF